MMGIRPIELRKAQRDLQAAYPENVTVWRRTGSRTAGGGSTYALARDSSGPGRLGPMGAEAESRIADRLGTSRGWVVTVYPDRDVQINDEIRIGSRKFQVIGWEQERSYPMQQRVQVREVTE